MADKADRGNIHPMEEGMGDEALFAPLAGFRALDLTDEQGFFCGRLLADFGMDVLKVERPGGDRSRLTPPYCSGLPDPEQSLYWFAYNQGKRSITLDYGRPDGRALLLALIERSDVLIESFPPGYLSELGIDYEELRLTSPRLVHTSITPFGSSGPYAHFHSCDLVTSALGGWTYLNGEPDRPPVVTGFSQSYQTGGADAAIGTLVALFHRERTGEGQHVDVSAQAGLIGDSVFAIPAWDLNQTEIRRSSPMRTSNGSGPFHRLIWPCADGHVVWYHVGGPAGAAATAALVKWMDCEGGSNELLNNTDWRKVEMLTVKREFLDVMESAVSTFLARHTKRELYEGAVQKRIMLYPVTDARDLLESPQLEARHFWTALPHPELGKVLTYPGQIAKVLDGRLPRLERAPRIGEHNEEVYVGELGLSASQLLVLKEAGVV